MRPSQMRCALYCRISTIGHGQSVEMQLRDLRQLAERRGLEVSKEYCDQGVSGSKDSRPALNEMLSDARRGKFRVLLVWRLDRLGRSLAHLVRLLEEFRADGVELVSLSEGLDFSTTTGKLLYQVISAFAEFERDAIRERICGGLRNARAKGRKLGRPRLIVDASKITRLRAQGRSLRAIAAELGCSHAFVNKSLAESQSPRVEN
jgi:DNA invertase Pin-like site-specific DNA recombinase